MTASHPIKKRKKEQSFTSLIEHDVSTSNREIVFSVVLKGTGLAMLALLALLFVSFGLLHNTYVLGRIIVCLIGVLYLYGAHLLSKGRHKNVAPFLLVGFYLALSIGTVWQWGIDMPFGILLLGLSIVLASTLLASANSLRVAFISCVTVIGLQIGQSTSWLHPDVSWNNRPSSMGNALGYCVIFAILALISWLFARQTERSLKRAETAEAALLEEKALLKVRIQERTEELRQAQMEELQQLHQFAEVGQLSTALLHDLANHLTILTLELEGIQSQKHATAISRARHILDHLDTMVDSVRDRLRGNNNIQTFSIPKIITEVVDFNRYRNPASNVRIIWKAPEHKNEYTYHGDPLRLSHVITIIVANAVDAYQLDANSTKQIASPQVTITLEQTDTQYVIHVIDYGRGINNEQRERLFKQISSSKKGGMGIGLRIAKEMLETQFKASIALSPLTDRTEFIISLPKEPTSADT